MSDSKKASEAPLPAADTAPGASAQRLQVNVRLQPHGDSAQPIYSNFATAQGAASMVFVDFGFLEPGALSAMARLAQTGGKMPEAINGQLACRIAMGLDSAVQLAQQLTQVLQSAAAQAQAQRATAAQSTSGK